MSAVRTYAVGGSQLFLEGLRCLLASTPYRVERLAKSLTEIDCAGDGDAGPALVILGMTAADSLDDVKRMRERLPDVRVVMLSGTADVEHFSACLAAGVDGYLLTDVSKEVLVECLQLVMLGESVFPTILSTWLLEKGGLARRRAPADSDHPVLSNRELEVLPLLIQGVSNKEIARQLGIADATVKIHVRRILKKINASNRTQAAVWALNSGLYGPLPFGEPPANGSA